VHCVPRLSRLSQGARAKVYEKPGFPRGHVLGIRLAQHRELRLRGSTPSADC
jgi:hypothetical protein